MESRSQSYAEPYAGNDPCSLIKGSESLDQQDPVNAAMLLRHAVDVLQTRIGSFFDREKQILSEELYRNPDNPMLLLRLAAVCENSGKPADAIEVYEKIIRMHDDPVFGAHGQTYDNVRNAEDLDEMVSRLSSREAQLVCFARGQKDLLEKSIHERAC